MTASIPSAQEEKTGSLARDLEAFRGACATCAGKLMVAEGLIEDIRAASQAYPSSECSKRIRDILGRHKPWASLKARVATAKATGEAS